MWIVVYIASLIGLVFGGSLIILDFWYIKFGFSFAMFAIGLMIALVSSYINVKLTN